MPIDTLGSNPLTLDNLDAGLTKYRGTFADEPFKGMLAWVDQTRRQRQSRLTSDAWLEWATDELARWRAWRPMSKTRGQDSLRRSARDLQDQVDAILQRCGQVEPTLEAVEWRTVSGLFATAFSIKPTASRSPVFASKLCHFIFPAAFPVVDGELLGGAASYPVYWHGCRGLWLECEEKDALKCVVAGETGISLSDDFPWATKIVEWCLIGERAPLDAKAAERHGA